MSGMCLLELWEVMAGDWVGALGDKISDGLPYNST